MNSPKNDYGELYNKINGTASLFLAVIMLASWMFRDVVEHREIKQEIKSTAKRLEDRIESILSTLNDRKKIDEKLGAQNLGNDPRSN